MNMDMDKDSRHILNHRWQLGKNFNRQVAEILYTVALSPVEVEGLVFPIYDDIKLTFERIWPGCVVKPFGSMVTGLALKDSDVDCFLQLPVQRKDHPAKYVEMCRSLIANGPSPFRQAAVRIKRVPTVRFVHYKTGRRCELSFNKAIAVEVSALVKYYMASDTRALKLALLIKYWAHTLNLTGKRILSSNALVILIISFLQHKRILPSVAALQAKSEAKIVDGWNTGFTQIRDHTHNVQSVYNLLGEFFVYYSEFDFRTLIVCPYLGYPVERCEFKNINSVPEAFQLYKENLNAGVCEPMFMNCIICVQDPFDHARNCTGHIRPQVTGEMICHFQKAAVIYAKSSREWILSKLLSYEYIETEQPEYRQRKPRNKRQDKRYVDRRGIARRGRSRHGAPRGRARHNDSL